MRLSSCFVVGQYVVSLLLCFFGTYGLYFCTLSGLLIMCKVAASGMIPTQEALEHNLGRLVLFHIVQKAAHEAFYLS